MGQRHSPVLMAASRKPGRSKAEAWRQYMVRPGSDMRAPVMQSVSGTTSLLMQQSSSSWAGMLRVVLRACWHTSASMSSSFKGTPEHSSTSENDMLPCKGVKLNSCALLQGSSSIGLR